MAELSWTAAHLREANSPDEVRAAIAAAKNQVGDAAIPAANVLAMLEEIALTATRARQDLRAATRARELLLSSVAHDLRNPLNTFAMSAGLLRDDLEGADIDRERALSLLTRMDRASGRMQGLIEDLLEASRIESGSFDLTMRPEQASSIVRAAIARARVIVLERGASIEEASIDDELIVSLDQARTIEALNKLVVVALRTTGEGGVIRLGVERATDHAIFSVRATPPRAIVSTAHDDSRGGLALLIARGLILAQGAKLTLEATPTGRRTDALFPLAKP